MPRPPLSLALRLVLSASVDGASRLGLLASLSPADPPAPASLPVSAFPATIATPARAQSRTGTRRAGRAKDERLDPELAAVLTMPRVIPLPRPRQSPDHDPGPSAA